MVLSSIPKEAIVGKLEVSGWIVVVVVLELMSTRINMVIGSPRGIPW